MTAIDAVGDDDAQQAVDMWTELADAFGEISESVTNAEVKSAAAQVHTDISAVRDSLQKIYIDGDMSAEALSEFTDVNTAWSESYTALLELCTP